MQQRMAANDQALSGRGRPPRRATSYDVAVAAGVAQSTVSRCFSDGNGISPGTRARVQAVAAALGYTPNALARSLIMQRSHTVGVIVTEFTLRANPDIVAGIGRALAQNGLRLLLMAVTDEAQGDDVAAGALGYPLDGLIVATRLTDAAIQPFLRRGVPVVFFNRPVSLPHVDRVATDHAEAAGDVARRLHAAGHRRFLCLGGPAGWAVNEERTRGFAAALSSLGVTGLQVVAAEQSYAGGRQAFGVYVAAHERPDAVFCVNDQLAFGVLDACRFDLPHGPAVSVVGFDDVPAAATSRPPLTTVRQEIQLMGRRMARLLLDRLDGQTDPVQEVLPTTLVVRETS